MTRRPKPGVPRRGVGRVVIALLVIVAASVSASRAAVARAEQSDGHAADGHAVDNQPVDDHPAASRMLLGVGMGRSLARLENSTARGTSSRGFATFFGATLGYDHRLIDWLRLAVTGGFFSWDSTAATDAGYLSRRVDLGLAPRLRAVAMPVLDSGIVEIYVSLPIGVSIPFVAVPARRAVDERVEGLSGWYAGCVLGAVVLLDRHWGMFFDAAYLRHASALRSTITPQDTTFPPVVERVENVDHQLLFSVGGLAAF